MTFGLGDPLYSSATWMDANLEKKLFECCLGCQKNWSLDDQAHLEKSQTEISRNGSKMTLFPLRVAPNSLCIVPSWSLFWALVCVENVSMLACWKSCPVYFPTQLEFLNLKLIFPSKTSFSQDCYLCFKKVAESPFLGVFWPLGGPDLFKISCPDTNSRDFQWKSKFAQICCNVDWRSPMGWHVEPRKPQPRF